MAVSSRNGPMGNLACRENVFGVPVDVDTPEGAGGVFGGVCCRHNDKYSGWF